MLGQESQISGPVWLAMFLASVQCLPLAFRRVNPVLVLICCGIPRNVYDVLNFGYAPLPIANAIAFATVAYQTRARWLRWGTLVATAGGISWAMTLPGHPLPYEAIVQFVIFGTAWVVGTILRARRQFFTDLTRRAERAEAELDAVAAQAASAAVTERVRIARELHDVVAHHVSLMAVQAEATGALLPDRPEAAAKSADLIASTARQAMGELRRLLGVLRGPSASAGKDLSERPGLTPAASLSRLDEVLDAVRAAGLPVTLMVDGDPGAGARGHRPDRVPDCAGGADEHAAARARFAGVRADLLLRRRADGAGVGQRAAGRRRPGARCSLAVLLAALLTALASGRGTAWRVSRNGWPPAAGR